MVDTPPSFLLPNQPNTVRPSSSTFSPARRSHLVQMRRTSDQGSLDFYISPYASGDPTNPFADSFDEAFYPLSIDPRAGQYSPNQYLFKVGGEAILPSPLLRPWLASTQVGEFEWTSEPVSTHELFCS